MTEQKKFSLEGWYASRPGGIKDRDWPSTETRIVNGERKEGCWGVYDRSIRDYLKDFRKLDHDKINEVIERIKTIENPMIIDLLSGTNALVSIKEEIIANKPMRGLAVGRADNRLETIKERDKLYGIEYRGGDLNELQSLKEIQAWSKGEANLVMSCGVDGLSFLPTSPEYYSRAITFIWNMLHPNKGVTLLQIAPSHALERNGIYMEPWLQQVQEAGILHRYVPRYKGGNICAPEEDFGLLMMEKNNSSSLPNCQRR